MSFIFKLPVIKVMAKILTPIGISKLTAWIIDLAAPMSPYLLLLEKPAKNTPITGIEANAISKIIDGSIFDCI